MILYVAFTYLYILANKWQRNVTHWLSEVLRVPSTVKPLILKKKKTSNISRTLVGNKIADHSDVVGASPIGAAPTTS